MALRNGADQRTVKAAAEQIADWRIGIHPLQNTFDEAVVDSFAYRLEIVMDHGIRQLNMRIGSEDAVLVISSGREGHNVFGNRHQRCRRRSEADPVVLCIAVEEGTDPDRVAGSDPGAFLRVIDHHRIFRIELRKHPGTELFIERQNNFTVTVRTEGVMVLFLESLLDGTEAIQLAVAYGGRAASYKRLHSFFVESHNGQAAEAHRSVADGENSSIIGSAVCQTCKAGLKCLRIR